MNERNRLLPAAILAALSPLAAHSATLCVNPGGTAGCYATLGAAVAAAAPGDAITVAAGTYSESGIAVTKPLSISGAGTDVTIVDGAVGGINSTQAIVRFSQSSGTSAISQMTVRGGARGLDLTGGNNVTVDHMRITANGPATGAGIFNGSSVLTVKASTIDGNSATDVSSIAGCDWGGASGGGIASLCGGGNNYISDSTIANNTAGRWGGGLIVNDGITVVENTTISGNTAGDPNIGGSAFFMGGAFPDILLRFTTIANNAGGGPAIFATEQMRFYASLLQNNGPVTCWQEPGRQIASLGYNVVSDASCLFTQAGDAQSTDAKLAPLADNGGDTDTHALPYSSPAVDRVPEADCTVFDDQRGVARPQHRACDSGAYEHAFTVKDLVAILVTQVSKLGPGNSLTAKIATIVAVFSDKHPKLACFAFKAMENEVRAQSGKKIPADKAAAIIRTLDDIEALIGC